MNTQHVKALLQLLHPESLEDDLFRGQSQDIETHGVSGGQALDQVLIAAQYTVNPAREVHSMHAYFLRPGDIRAPIIYNVERTRVGGRFSMRRVAAIQHGQPILDTTLSFQQRENGFEHPLTMSDIPNPEELGSARSPSADKLAEISSRLRLEFRQVLARNESHPAKYTPAQYIWFRLSSPMAGNNARQHRARLAYASEFHRIDTSRLPHDASCLNKNVQMTSLDHALWFHRAPCLNEWMLSSFDSPMAQGGRTLSHTRIFSRDGQLVASSTQEVLVRHRNPAPGQSHAPVLHHPATRKH